MEVLECLPDINYYRVRIIKDSPKPVWESNSVHNYILNERTKKISKDELMIELL